MVEYRRRDRPADRVTVRATYDRIADHFAATRAAPWPPVERFVAELPHETGTDLANTEDGAPGQLRSASGGDHRRPNQQPNDDSTRSIEREAQPVALDIGCGNGRHAALFNAHRVVGLDLSAAVLATAQHRENLALVQADAVALPIGTDVAAAAVYVATLHHLPTRDLRIASLDELARVLDGQALISAWCVEHPAFEHPSETAAGDSTVECTDIAPGSGFDADVIWTLPDGERVPRYYRIYHPTEFEADLAESRLTVERVWTEAGNCWATVTDP